MASSCTLVVIEIVLNRSNDTLVVAHDLRPFLFSNLEKGLVLCSLLSNNEKNVHLYIYILWVTLQHLYSNGDYQPRTRTLIKCGNLFSSLQCSAHTSDEQLHANDSNSQSTRCKQFGLMEEICNTPYGDNRRKLSLIAFRIHLR